jgi:hypothetical protein
MICSKCAFDNLPDATQCESCGESLIAKLADQENSGEVVTGNEAAEQEVKPVFLPVENVIEGRSTVEEKVEGYPGAVVSDLSGQKKTGKSIRFMVTVFIIVLAVIAGLGFMFRNKILKQISPERYLQVSLSRTFSDKNHAKLLDMSKFDKKPVKYEISVEAEGVGAEGSLMYDAKGEKALFEAVLDDGTTVYDDNLLYISREVIAISIPELLTESDFLTIDPATFAEDIKDLGVAEAIPKEYMDQALDMFFGKSVNGETNTDEIAEYYREAKFFEEYAEFSQGKSITEKINGESYKLDAMCYKITEEKANEYLQDLLEGYKQGLLDGMGSMYQEDQASIDSAFEMFDSFRIKGDIVITYYVDGNDYVRKIVMDEFELAMEGEEVTIAIEFEMLLGGKKNPTDNISAILTLSADGEEVELGMNWEESLEKDVFQGELEFFVEGNGNTEDMGATIEIEWDTKDTKGENFKAELTIDGADGVSIEVIGTLVDGKKSTTFTDGELIINDGYSDEIVVEFEYSISIIDAKDITVDLDDSMPLMEYVEEQNSEVAYATTSSASY